MNSLYCEVVILETPTGHTGQVSTERLERSPGKAGGKATVHAKLAAVHSHTANG